VQRTASNYKIFNSYVYYVVYQWDCLNHSHTYPMTKTYNLQHLENIHIVSYLNTW